MFVVVKPMEPTMIGDRPLMADVEEGVITNVSIIFKVKKVHQNKIENAT